MSRWTLKNLRIVLWGLALVAFLAAVWFSYLAPKFQGQITDTLGRGDYHLTTTDGAEFTQSILKGAPSAVFFGFTHCPDVCPTTMGDIAAWKDALGEAAKDLRVFFVTVDPERDTAELLGGYVSWVPGVTGVTGSRAETDKALKAFKIYARKVPLEGGDYTMDHSSLILLFDRRGRFAEPVGYQEDYVRVIAKLNRLLAN